MTIKQFIAQEGGMTKAAAKLGVHFNTLYRWNAGSCKPSGLYADKLKENGIEIKIRNYPGTSAMSPGQ